MKQINSAYPTTPIDAYSWPHAPRAEKKYPKEKKAKLNKILTVYKERKTILEEANQDKKPSAPQSPWKLVCAFLALLIVLTTMTIAGYHVGKPSEISNALSQEMQQ